MVERVYAPQLQDPITKPTLERIFDWLLEPSESVQEPFRLEARSVSSLLLLLTVITLIGLFFSRASSGILLGSDIVLATSYAMSRTKYYRAAGILAVAVLSVAPFFAMFNMNEPHQEHIVTSFIWLVLPVLLSSFIFSLRGTILLIASYIMIIAMLPVFTPSLSFSQVVDLLAIIGIVAGFSFLVTHTREVNMRELTTIQEREQTANVLLESEERYHNLFEYANDAIFITDPHTLMFLDVNKNASEQLGYSRDELLQLGMVDIFSPETIEQNQAVLDQLRTKGSVVFESNQMCKDGAEMLVEVSSHVVEFGTRQVFQSIARDISARKYAEDQLRQYSDRLVALHQIEHAMISAQSPEEISDVALARLREVIHCRRASISQYDYETQEVLIYALASEPSDDPPYSIGVRIPFDDFKIPDELYKGDIYIEEDFQNLSNPTPLEQGFIQMGINSAVNIPLTIQGELWGSLNLGGPLETKTFPAHSIEVALEVAGLISVALQQATLFKEIRMGRARLQALSRRLVEAQEAERYRIANELHDEIGQALTGINLALGTYMRTLDSDQEYAPLLAAQTIAEELVVRVQRMSLDLRPAMLDDLGLLPTLTWHFDRYQGQTSIQVLFDHQNIEGRFPREIETASYRIVQEALTNVARHANVKEVRVRTSMHDDVLLIFIEDRGEGFSVDSALASGNASGLVGMRERALSLGGDLKIMSTQSSGTQISAELPLKARMERRAERR